MKMKVAIGVLAMFLCATVSSAQPTAQQSFAALKRLAGEWRGTDSLGHAVEITFRVTAGGTALMSELRESSHQHPGESEDMISMIHLDGDRLMLTHYCGAGNQPRMVASSSPDGHTITFEFADATNLASASAGHMLRVVITLSAPDKHTEEWTFVEGGKESRDLFEMHRAML